MSISKRKMRHQFERIPLVLRLFFSGCCYNFPFSYANTRNSFPAYNTFPPITLSRAGPFKSVISGFNSLSIYIFILNILFTFHFDAVIQWRAIYRFLVKFIIFNILRGRDATGRGGLEGASKG